MNLTRKEIYSNIKIRKPEIIGQQSYQEFVSIIFWHPVSEDRRLSKHGYMILKQFYKPYIIDVLAGLEKNDIPSKHYIFLARYCKSPYYIGTNKIIFFDEEEGFVFKMCDGDIENVNQITKDDTN